MTEAERARSVLERVVKATKKAPLAATRRNELAAGLLWLLEMAKEQSEREAEPMKEATDG